MHVTGSEVIVAFSPELHCSAWRPSTATRNLGPVTPNPWLKTVLSDIQFWVPVVVLVGGLFVLRWIQ
jgi:hypothetical protein